MGKLPTIDALEKKGFNAPRRLRWTSCSTVCRVQVSLLILTDETTSAITTHHPARRGHGEPLGPPGPFVQLETIKSIEEFRIMDVDVIRICADHGTVFLVHFLDLPDVGMSLEDIVIRFMPVCRRGKLGARVLGQWMERDPIQGQAKVVNDLGQHGIHDQSD